MKYLIALMITFLVSGCAGALFRTATIRTPSAVGTQVAVDNRYAGGAAENIDVSYAGRDSFAPAVNTCIDTYTGVHRVQTSSGAPPEVEANPVDINTRLYIVSICQNMIRQNIPAPQWGMYMANNGWNGQYGNQFAIAGRFSTGAMPYVGY